MLRLQSLPARYGFAIAATGIASLLYFLAGPQEVDSDMRRFGFVLAIVGSALLGGLGPGLFATGLSILSGAYLFLAPIYSFKVNSAEDTSRLIVFAGEGLMLSLVGQMVRDGRTADVDLSWARRYVPAVLFVSAATGLKLLVFRPLAREVPFTLFYVAVCAAALVGGFGPGLLATLLSSLAARFFFLDPLYSLSVAAPLNAARTSLFIAEGILLSGISSKYPKLRGIARDAIALARQHQLRSKRSVEDVRALRLTTRDVVWEWDLNTGRMTRGATRVERPDAPTAAMNFSSWLLQIHPEDRLMVRTSLASALREGHEQWRCEYRMLRPDGRSAHVADHAYIIRDSAGNPVRLVGRTEDLRESRRDAPALSKERQYQAVFEQSPVAMLLTDSRLRVVTANHAACEMLRYGQRQLKDLRVEALFEEERGQLIKQMRSGLDPHGRNSIAVEEDCMRADGAVFPARVNAAWVSRGDDGSTGWVVLIEESTRLNANVGAGAAVDDHPQRCSP